MKDGFVVPVGIQALDTVWMLTDVVMFFASFFAWFACMLIVLGPLLPKEFKSVAFAAGSCALAYFLNFTIGRAFRWIGVFSGILTKEQAKLFPLKHSKTWVPTPWPEEWQIESDPSSEGGSIPIATECMPRPGNS